MKTFVEASVKNSVKTFENFCGIFNRNCLKVFVNSSVKTSVETPVKTFLKAH